ncbi:MAG: family N-acetyltransferase [Candidatus Saccharibacteria bacterium]|nr:family N-acetyltransferase [Candidatus Saccharibacteria bacterium]
MTMQLPEHYTAVDLTRDYATEHAAELTLLANTIPLVTYTEADILADCKPGRWLHAKWEHGLAVERESTPIAFIAAHECTGFTPLGYPVNTIYISELAVHEDHRRRGIATALLQGFFAKNDCLGLQVLRGKTRYSVQTNAEGWNDPVISMYKSFGFSERTLKQYPNRCDVVLEKW